MKPSRRPSDPDPICSDGRRKKEAGGRLSKAPALGFGKASPGSGALSGWVLGSESFLQKAIAIAQADDDQARQRTVRRLKAVTAEQIISETAAYHDVAATEYVGFRSGAAGREMATFLCRRWTGESLSSLSQRLGLAHPDSSSNLVWRAKSRMEKSKQYRQAIDDIEHNLGLKTENLA
jgi:putative transposase